MGVCLLALPSSALPENVFGMFLVADKPLAYSATYPSWLRAGGVSGGYNKFKFVMRYVRRSSVVLPASLEPGSRAKN